MNIHNLVYAVLITLLPGIELRGSIVYGIGIGENPILVFLLCTIANILLIFPIFFFLNFIFPYFEHLPIIQPILERTRGKTNKYVEKYGFIGLAIFVAIPLPGSGAYSGALGAYLLGMKKRRAMPAIALGVVIAGILVTLAAVGFFAVLFSVM